MILENITNITVDKIGEYKHILYYFKYTYYLFKLLMEVQLILLTEDFTVSVG